MNKEEIKGEIGKEVIVHMNKARRAKLSAQKHLDDLRGEHIFLWYQKPFLKPYKVCCDLCESAWKPETGSEWHNVGCPIADAAMLVRADA